MKASCLRIGLLRLSSSCLWGPGSGPSGRQGSALPTLGILADTARIPSGMSLRRNLLRVLAVVVVHLVLCYSVIDIHFQSPIVHGIPPVAPNTTAPAKRLVLIVADGTLRCRVSGAHT